MKRFLAAFLAAVMAMSLMSPGVFAAEWTDGPTVSLAVSDLGADGSVEVTVSISESTADLMAYILSVIYDPDLVVPDTTKGYQDRSGAYAGVAFDAIGVDSQYDYSAFTYNSARTVNGKTLFTITDTDQYGFGPQGATATFYFKVKDEALETGGKAEFELALGLDTSTSPPTSLFEVSNGEASIAEPTKNISGSVAIPTTQISIPAGALTDPTTGATAPNSLNLTPTPAGYTSSVSWNPTPTNGVFQASTAYTATVTLTPAEGYAFSDDMKVSYGDVQQALTKSGSSVSFTKSFEATAALKTPTITTCPTAGEITYGQTLNDSALSGGVAQVGGQTVTGTFAWQDPSAAPAVADSGEKYTVVFTPDEPTKYASATCQVAVTVHPKTITPEVGTGGDQPYTGSQIILEIAVYDSLEPGVLVKLVPDQDYTVTYGENIDAGVDAGSATIRALPGGNYTFEEFTVYFTIKQAQGGITIQDPGEIVYDGSPVTAGTTEADLIYQYTGDGAVTVKWYADNSGKKGSELSGAPTDADTYWIGVSAAAGTNYEAVAEVAKPFTISPKKVEVNWNGLDTTYTYTGAEQTGVTAAFTGVGSGVTVNCTVSYAKDGETEFKNAGTYTVTAATNNANYTLTNATQSVTIGKATLNPSVATVDAKTFDGTTAGAGTIQLTGAVNSEQPAAAGTFTWTSANAGTSTVNVSNITLTDGWDKNYTLSATSLENVNAGTSIQKAAVVPLTAAGKTLLSSTVTSEPRTYDYALSQISGIPENAGTVSYAVTSQGTYATAAIEGGVLKITVNTPQPANTTDTIVLTVTTTNYQDMEATIALTFKDKTDVTSQLKLDDITVTYGEAFTVQGAYGSAAYDAANWTYTYQGTGETSYPSSTVKPSDAGTYTVTAAYEDDVLEGDVPGHVGTVTATLTIQKKTLTVDDGTVTVTKEYDGNTNPGILTGTLGLTGVVDGDTVSVDMGSVTVGAYSAAGYDTYTVILSGITLTGVDAGNYTVADTYSFTKATITKTVPKAANLSFTLPTGATYTGSAQPVAVTAAEGVTGLGDITVKYQMEDGTETTAAPVNAGAYAVIASLAEGANYAAADISLGDFTIGKADRVLTVTPDTLTLIPGALTGAITASTATDADKSAVITFASGNTLVAMVNSAGKVTAAGNGTTTVTVSIAETANYNAVSGTVAVRAVTEPITGVTVTGETGDQLTATVSGTTIKVTGTTSDMSKLSYTFITASVSGVTCTAPVVADGKVTLSVNGTELTYTLDTSAVTVLPAGVTVSENVPSSGAKVEGVKDALPQSVIDAAKKAVEDAEGVASAEVKITTTVAKDENGVMTLSAAYTVEGTKEDGSTVTLVKATPLPSVTQPITVTASAPAAGTGTVYAKHTRSNGQVEYLTTTTSGGNVSFRTADLSGTFQLVRMSDQVTITFTYNDGSQQTVTYTAADVGALLPTDSKDGFTFRGWTIGGKVYTAVTEELLMQEDSRAEPSFTSTTPVTPPAPDPTPGGSVSGGSSGDSSDPEETITVRTPVGATISPDGRVKVDRGEDQTFRITPKSGYRIVDILVDGSSVFRDAVAKANGVYEYTMENVKRAHTLTVETAVAEALAFQDVPESYWAYESIAWAYENGYMGGYSATVFNPNGSVTRQQLWMILARLAGERPADMAAARTWAINSGISDGTNPGTPVTRQQMVTILYRYAVLMGYRISDGTSLTQFPDYASAASYAADALSWAVGNGILTGTTDGKLNPAGSAYRAQFATILKRFCENIAG